MGLDTICSLRDVIYSVVSMGTFDLDLDGVYKQLSLQRESIKDFKKEKKEIQEPQQ